MSEWVRRTLREARERETGGDLDTKLRAIRAAARHEFPAPDVEQMLDETERGYLERRVPGDQATERLNFGDLAILGPS